MVRVNLVRTEQVSTDTADSVEALRFMADSLGQFSGNVTKSFQRDSAEEAGSRPSLVAAYAGASPVARRRFEAMLREAEAVGTMGLRLMSARGGRSDAGTIAAASFLGKSLTTTIGRLEALLLPRAA
jgi:hypothetical protein